MAIEAHDIRKSFGALEVLKGIDVDVRDGEIVAIEGPSGAGKSTLLQIMGTLLTPTSGTLRLSGTDVSALDSRALPDFRCRHIGFVFQAPHLLPEFTALENVMIPSLIAGSTRVQARGKASDLLRKVGLGARMDHKPSQMSGGEQQRVAIARALINSPETILADEPTGNLDSVNKAGIQNLLFGIRDDFGSTLVIVTHDGCLAAACDRTVSIRDGRVFRK